MDGFGCKATINQVSDEVLVRILSHTASSELIETTLNVCQRWRRLSGHQQLWTHRELSIDRDVDVATTLPLLSGVCTVLLKSCLNSAAIQIILENCPDLTTLKFSNSQRVGVELLQKMNQKCPNIRCLRIPADLLKNEYKAQALAQLQHLNSLELVKLSAHNTPIHLRPLEVGCPALAELKIAAHIDISKKDIEYFLMSKRNTLTHLTLPSNLCTKRCLELIHQCASLTSLELVPGLRETEQDFRGLRPLSNIRLLRITRIEIWPEIIAAALRFGRFPHLQVLEFSDMELMEAAVVVAVCDGCKDLRQLRLQRCHKLSDLALCKLDTLTQLHTLCITDCRGFRGDAMIYVAQVKTLRNLFIERMILNRLNPGLWFILKMVQLEILSLSYVSHEKIFPLDRIAVRLTNLRILKLKGNLPKWKVKAVQEGLKQQTKRLDVQFEVKGDSDARGLLDNTAAINDLSDEVLVQILSYLTSSELLETTWNVCQRWRTVSGDSELWRHKELCVHRDVNVEAVVPRLRGVRCAVLKCDLRAPAFQAIVDSCPELATLKIPCSQRVGVDLLKKLVDKCPEIRFLTVPVKLLKEERKTQLLAQLQKLKSLEVLSVPRWINRCELRPLASGCPELAVLKVPPYVNISTADMESLLTSKRETLTYLTLPTDVCTRRCLELVNECRSLVTLEIVPANEDETEDFTPLELASNLRQLIMKNFRFFSSGTAASAFRSGGLLQLLELELNDVEELEDDVLLAVCEGCPELRQLRLSRCPSLTDQGFSQLNRLSQLETLNITSCKRFSIEAVPYVAQVTTLRNLFLEEMDLGKLRPGLERILDLIQLQVLGLSYVRQESVFPFERLAGSLPNLRSLKLKGNLPNWKLKAFLQRLKQQIPHVDVHFDRKL